MLNLVVVSGGYSCCSNCSIHPPNLSPHHSSFPCRVSEECGRAGGVRVVWNEKMVDCGEEMAGGSCVGQVVWELMKFYKIKLIILLFADSC